MDQLDIDISDKIEELGILFANLIEDYPLNKLLRSDLHNPASAIQMMNLKLRRTEEI